MKDYYEILDVPLTATREEIKAQYKQLVRVYHPDRFRDATDKAYAEEKLKQINIAFQVLCGTPMQPLYDNGAGAPQPVAYPPVLDFGVIRYGEKRTLPLQIGNVGGPVASLQLRSGENSIPFQISPGKPVYADRSFPVNYEVSIDTRHLTPNITHQSWLEVNLDGVYTRVEVRLHVSPAPQRTVRPQRQFQASTRWLTIALATLLICVVVAALPVMDSFTSLSTLILPSFFSSSSLHELEANNLLFAVGENGAPTIYVSGAALGQPKALGVNGRSAVGSAASQAVAYLGLDHEVHLLDVGSGRSQSVTTDGEAKAELQWSPDGTQLAYLVGEGERSRIGLYTVATGVHAELPGNGATGVSDFAWSPAGDVLAFALWQGVERRVYRINTDGSALQQLTHNDSWSPAWSADGRTLVVSSAQGLQRLDSQGRTVTTISNVAGEAPSWSADGNWLAYLTSTGVNGEQTLWLLEVASGQTQEVTSESVSYHWSPTGATLGYVTGRARGETPLLYLWTMIPDAQPTLVAEINDPLFQWAK